MKILPQQFQRNSLFLDFDFTITVPYKDCMIAKESAINNDRVPGYNYLSF